MSALREIGFQECGGVQVVMASREPVKFIDGVVHIPPAYMEVVLAYSLDFDQQCQAWEALTRVPEPLLPAAMELLGEGFALRLCDGYRSP